MLRIKILALLPLFVINLAFAKAQDVITLWEDSGKSLAIIEKIHEFEKQFNCTVNVLEKDATKHLDLIQSKQEATPDVFILLSDRMTDAYSNNLIAPLLFMENDRTLYEDVAVEAFSVDKTVYASPRSIETLVVYYNQDLLEYPFETLEEYARFAEQLEGEDKYSLIANFSNFYYASTFFHPNGAYTFGKFKNNTVNVFDIGLNNKNSVSSVKELKDYAQRVMPKEALSKKSDSVIDLLFTQGKAAAVINGPEALLKYSKSGINFAIAPLPKLKNGKNMNGFYGVKGYAISSESKNKQLAEDLIRFLNNEENAQERYFSNAELPPLKSLLSQSFISCDELANTMIAQINAQTSRPMPSVHKMRSVWTNMELALEQILNSNNNDISVVLNKAVQKIKDSD